VDRKRRPWAAALVTLIQPGLGHLYAGAPARAVGAAIITFLAAPLWGVSILFLSTMPLLVLIVTLIFLSIVLGIALDAAHVAKGQPAKYALGTYNRWSVYLTWIVAVGVLAGSGRELTKKHLVQAFRLPSGSMEPSLQLGDFIFVRMFRPSSHLHHGSIVVFESTEESGLKVIKRVVGLPGDTVAMRDGAFYRNGVAVTEPYVIHEDPARREDPVHRARMRAWQVTHWTVSDTHSSYAPDLQSWGPIRVPADSLFLLGDNRDHSYDSRYFGFVPRDHIIGRPMFVYYSYDPSSPRQWRWFSAARWHRVGTQLPE
jgi:signal peptidase I